MVVEIVCPAHDHDANATSRATDIEKPPQLDSVLTDWRTYCDSKSIQHDMCRLHFQKVNLWLAVPAMLLSTIAGAANIGVGTNVGQDNKQINWLSVGFGAMGMLSAALFAIHRYVNAPELQKMHDMYADQFEILAQEIRMHQALETSTSPAFVNRAEYTKSCKRTLDVLIEKAPAVPEWIKRSKKVSEVKRSAK